MKIVFAPVLNHGNRSDLSHLAAECAAEQGKIWKFHDLLFENQDALWGAIDAVVKQFAVEADLDTQSFNSCYDEQRDLDLVYKQDQFRQDAGIRGQPVFYINGDYLVGDQEFEVFQATIESKLGQ